MDSGGPKEVQVQSCSPGGANVRNFNRIHQVATMYSTTLCRELCKETAEPIDLPFGLWTRVGRKKHIFNGGYIGANWRIQLNRLSAAAMRSYVKLL